MITLGVLILLFALLLAGVGICILVGGATGLAIILDIATLVLGVWVLARIIKSFR